LQVLVCAEPAGRTHARRGRGLATGGAPRTGVPRRVPCRAEPAIVPRMCLCRGACAWTLAGRTPARHGCGRTVEMNARRALMSRRAPWRACSRPAFETCVRACEFRGERRDRSAQRRVQSRRRCRCRRAGCAAARRGERLREEQGASPGCGRIRSRWASCGTWPIGQPCRPTARMRPGPGDQGGLEDFLHLGQLGRAQWATFGPVSLSAHQQPTNPGALTSC
jgi:hypothetical protein